MSEENKYHPFSEEEFVQLKETLSKITTFLPEHYMDYIWNMVSRLRGQKVARPCSCKSSAKHWGAAVTDLKNFIKERDSE